MAHFFFLKKKKKKTGAWITYYWLVDLDRKLHITSLCSHSKLFGKCGLWFGALVEFIYIKTKFEKEFFYIYVTIIFYAE